MAESGNLEELFKGVNRAVKKSVEANNAYWQDMAITWKQLYTGPKGASVDGIVETLSDSWKHWIQLQSKYVESLLEIQSTSPSTAPENKTEVFEEATVVKEQRKEMSMRGVAGETAVMLLRLRNNDTGQYSCQLTTNGFFDFSTGQPSAFFLKFNPETFLLLPNDELEVQLYVSIPTETKPGQHRATIVIEGYKNSIFDLVLLVENQAAEPVEEKITPPAPKSTPRKKAAAPAKAQQPDSSIKKSPKKKN